MTAVTPLPRAGNVLFDVRDGGRTLRVSHHRDVWVISTWVGGNCVSSFQLRRPDVAELIVELARGLAVEQEEWSPPKLARFTPSRRRPPRLPRFSA